MARDRPKQALFGHFAEVAKALGHGRRLEILELLAQGERSVDSLAGRAGLPIANASQHLRLMWGAGPLASRRDGKRILYRLGDPAVLDLVAARRRVALLRRRGFRVRRLEDGFPEWRAAGLPVGRLA